MRFLNSLTRAALICAFVCYVHSTKTHADEPKAASSGDQIMKWPDLFSREQPKPDDTLVYGKHRLQLVDVWKPEGQEPVPAILMIHGGCWQTEIAERDIMNWIADDLRRHGVGVWNIEYRGVDEGGGYPNTYLDVAQAADLFRDRAADYGFQTKKMIVIGHSAGGHLALWLANRPKIPASEVIRGSTPIHIDVAISQGGLPDLQAASGRDGHPCGTDAPFAMMGAERRLTKVTSPPEMLPGDARQILFHNSLDRIAPPKFAQAYIDAVRPNNVDVKLIETPAEGHVELVAPDSKSWVQQRTLILHELGLQ